jgi:hypothetical protein
LPDGERPSPASSERGTGRDGTHPTLVFFRDGKELGERLSGEDIKRTALKAQVEALLA